MSLQAEWQFVRRVTKVTLANLTPIEAALKQRFLPELFGEGQVTAELQLTKLPLKASGMEMPDPTSMEHQAYASSARVVQHLTAALVGNTVFCADQHAVEAKQAQVQTRKTSEQRICWHQMPSLRPSCSKQSTLCCMQGRREHDYITHPWP